MVPHDEKVVPTLVLTENDVHAICLYDIDGAKVILKGAVISGEYTLVLSIMGIDCLVTSDYNLLPMDREIAEQIVRTYIGVIGLRSHNYYQQNTLRSVLEE